MMEKYNTLMFSTPECIQLSKMQNGIRFYEDREGFVAYKKSLGRKVVLGSPVAKGHSRGVLTEKFIEKNPKSIFTMIEQDFVKELGKINPKYNFCPIGTEQKIKLSEMSSKEHPKILGSMKWANKMDFSLEETSISNIQSELIGTINFEHLKNRPINSELSFINRPLSFDHISQFSRMFFMKQKENIFGYIIIDAIFENGKIKGYLLNLIRHKKTKQWGVYLASVMTLAEILRQENDQLELSLGLSPLTTGEVNDDLLISEKIKKQLNYFHQKRFDFNVSKGLEEFKSILSNVPDTTIYIATESESIKVPLIRVLRACEISFRPLIRDELQKIIKSNKI